MKDWDVFISYASEDKADAASPLAEALRRAGVRVWLDGFEIQIGDSIRAKIDEGLAHSRYGVAILSDAYFRKAWTGRELDALFERDVVLPVWHGVDRARVAQCSPLLAARKAALMSEGADVVAQLITSKIFRPLAGSMPGVARQLATLLGESVNPHRLVEFITSTPILSHAIGVGEDDYLRTSIRLADFTVDICAAKYQPSTGRHADWHLLLFGLPNDALFSTSNQPTPHLGERVSIAKSLFRWIPGHLQEVTAILPDFNANFLTTIVVGRRAEPTSPVSGALRQLNESSVGLTVRTYDWLLDHALAIDAEGIAT